MELTIKNEFKHLLPSLTQEQQEGLEKDILAHGCLHPLIIWNGILIDGHHRYDILRKHNLNIDVINMQFSSELEAMYWIWINQKNRRNLSAWELGKHALMFEPIIKKRAKENQGTRTDIPQNSAESLSPIETREEIAKIAGVSHDTISKVKVIESSASNELKQKLDNQEISINQAYQQIKTEERKKEFENKLDAQKEDCKNIIIDEHTKYNVIVIDPPWKYDRTYDPETSRVASPYPEMSIDELRNIKIPSADDCIMWLWTTHKFIFDAKNLLEHWGFDYKAIMVWNKQSMGMGYWLRMQCEFCLLGIKGNPLWNNTNYRDIVDEKRREHSRKPDAFYAMIDDICAGLKLDYFSRTNRSGWTCFGNDTQKF